MKTNLKKIEAERDRLNAILRKESDRKERAEKQKLIGKHFVYRNSYGPGESWNLYIRVERLDEDGGLIGTKFEKTTRQINIEADKYLGYIHEGNGYTEIPKSLFDAALAKLKAEIAQI